jgi:hypothetical protein
MKEHEFLITYHDHSFEKIKIDLYEYGGILKINPKHIGRGYVKLRDLSDWHKGLYIESVELFKKNDTNTKTAQVQVQFSFSPVILPDENGQFQSVSEMSDFINSYQNSRRPGNNDESFDDILHLINDLNTEEHHDPQGPSNDSPSSDLSYRKFLKSKTMSDIKLMTSSKSLSSKPRLLKGVRSMSFSKNSGFKKDVFHMKQAFELLTSAIKNDTKLSSLEFSRAISLLYKFENGLPIPRTGMLFKDTEFMKTAARFMDHSTAVYGALFMGFCTNTLSAKNCLRSNADQKCAVEFLGLELKDILFWYRH